MPVFPSDSLLRSENEQVRATRHHISQVQEIESLTAIGEMMAGWRRARPEGCLAPTREQFDLSTDDVDHFMRADVRPENPYDFKIAYFTSDGVSTLASLRLIFDTDTGITKKQLLDDLIYVKERVEPLYESVLYRQKRQDDWQELVFSRLLVPTVGIFGTTEYVFSTTRVMGAPTRIYHTTAQSEF